MLDGNEYIMMQMEEWHNAEGIYELPPEIAYDPDFIDLKPKPSIYNPVKDNWFNADSAIVVENDGYLIFKNEMRDGGFAVIKTKSEEYIFIQGIDIGKACPGALGRSRF